MPQAPSLGGTDRNSCPHGECILVQPDGVTRGDKNYSLVQRRGEMGVLEKGRFALLNRVAVEQSPGGFEASLQVPGRGQLLASADSAFLYYGRLRISLTFLMQHLTIYTTDSRLSFRQMKCYLQPANQEVEARRKGLYSVSLELKLRSFDSECRIFFFFLVDHIALL